MLPSVAQHQHRKTITIIIISGEQILPLGLQLFSCLGSFCVWLGPFLMVKKSGALRACVQKPSCYVMHNKASLWRYHCMPLFNWRSIITSAVSLSFCAFWNFILQVTMCACGCKIFHYLYYYAVFCIIHRVKIDLCSVFCGLLVADFTGCYTHGSCKVFHVFFVGFSREI